MENGARVVAEKLTPEFVQKVIVLQKRVHVGKERDNTFADFKYRSIDDIFQKTKPAAAELGLLLFLTDSMVVRGNRFYVEATAFCRPAAPPGISTGRTMGKKAARTAKGRRR